MRPFLLWLILALMVAAIAHGKGRSAWLFFLLSMIATPVVGFAAVLLIPPHPLRVQEELRKGTLRKCLNCGHVSRSEAKICPKCLQPRPEIIDVTPIDAP